MEFWTIISGLSSLITLGQAFDSGIQKYDFNSKKMKNQIDNIIDYAIIAQDLHDVAEKVEQYIVEYHADYVSGNVLLEKEQESFLKGFYDKYPNLRSNKDQVNPYLYEYLKRLDCILQKEMTLSEKIILRQGIDNNYLLHKIARMILEIIEKQKKECSLEPYNANLIYVESFCHTLFLHKNQKESKVNLQNLFVMQKHLIANENGYFVKTECSLEQEIEQFFGGEKTALFIEGDAGSGKSTLVSWMNYHYFLKDDVAKRLFGERPVVTVRLRDLDRDKINNNRMINAILSYLNISMLDDLVDNYPSAIMILDGFDELCMIEGLVDYEYLIADIFRKNLPGFQFVITTRPKYLDIDKIDVRQTHIYLKHFSKEQIIRWLDKYIHICGEQVSDFIEDYIRNLVDSDNMDAETNSDAIAVCDTPMTLYMIVAKRISEDALMNHWMLYHQIFFTEISDAEYNKMFPNKEWRYEHPIHHFKDLLYQISEEIAYEMYRTGNKKLQLSDVQIRQIITNILNNQVTDDEIYVMSERCYALCTYWKADNTKGFVEFYHNNIRDFFLCERIYRRMNMRYRSINDINDNEFEKLLNVEFKIVNDLCEDYHYSPLATKVCQFIYERSLYECIHNMKKTSFPQIENKEKMFPKIFQSMLSFEMKYSMIPKENNIRILSNIFTCTAQIFRYTAEPFLKTINETEPNEEEILFKWWIEVNHINTIGTLKYLFRFIFHQAPVTYDDGIMISMSNKSDFSGLNLADCDLREINFRYSNLSNAVFSNAAMDRCDLRDTKRDNTDFANISDKDMIWYGNRVCVHRDGDDEKEGVRLVMKNIIQDELELVKSKMIEEVTFQGKTLAKLTRDNVAIVEAMIRNDSAYIRSADVNAAPDYNRKGEVNYGGSSAYWMTLLKKVLLENKPDSTYTYEEIIKGAVESVDRENSTHLNADKCGRQEITERIYQFDRNEFVKCLKDPDYGNMKLICEISRKTSAEKGARSNLSFASKFCHYVCFYVFEGTEYQDNYSIYDRIIKTVLHLYLGYYQIGQEYDLRDYKDYRMAVDSVREASGIAISRNGFDHLLWYYHKGRL